MNKQCHCITCYMNRPGPTLRTLLNVLLLTLAYAGFIVAFVWFLSFLVYPIRVGAPSYSYLYSNLETQ